MVKINRVFIETDELCAQIPALAYRLGWDDGIELGWLTGSAGITWFVGLASGLCWNDM